MFLKDIEIYTINGSPVKESNSIKHKEFFISKFFQVAVVTKEQFTTKEINLFLSLLFSVIIVIHVKAGPLTRSWEGWSVDVIITRILRLYSESPEVRLHRVHGDNADEQAAVWILLN